MSSEKLIACLCRCGTWSCGQQPSVGCGVLYWSHETSESAICISHQYQYQYRRCLSFEMDEGLISLKKQNNGVAPLSRSRGP